MNSGEDGVDGSEFVEVDPTGRYGRYNDILGKGSSKTVYRGFDEYEGIEVAWNQVKLYDFLQSPDDLKRLYCEIHLLKTIKHRNIMKLFTSWVDVSNRNINFVTEMFTSGTLRQYRMKHKRVNIRAIKHWCRQILQGLHYLHSHDPPIIHRDLKCDNIFINGHLGEVKIGDLGLAAILRKSHAAHCVGTPEFMAPEVYEEEYNELVDVYSFGMCILEMVTFEYPYSECSHPAQIYKKVILGKKPDALYTVKDPGIRQFVEKCLALVSDRLSAWELLNDPFLQNDDHVYDLWPLSYQDDYDETGLILNQSLLSTRCSTSSSLINSYGNFLGYEHENDFDSHLVESEENGIDLFASQGNNHSENVDVTIKGQMREDDNIFLRLRIADKEGLVRNIYFPFNIETDSALSVAMEMASELEDITDHDVTKIAEMIDGEIASLVPNWKKGIDTKESHDLMTDGWCHHCVSNGSLASYLSSQSSGKNLHVLQCSRHGCGAIHGRFEEITYQFNESEQHVTSDDASRAGSNPLGDGPFTDIWAQHDVNSQLDYNYPSIDEHKDLNPSAVDKRHKIQGPYKMGTWGIPGDYENEIRQEMRWLKAKYQMQLRKIKDRQLGIMSRPDPGPDNFECKKPSAWEEGGDVGWPTCNSFSRLNGGMTDLYSVPYMLHRSTSLPVDATDA